MQSRRKFLTYASACGLAGLTSPVPGVYYHQAQQNFGDLRVTQIECHDIYPEYQDFLDYVLMHFYGPSKRTVYIVHTNKGLVGLGESNGAEPETTLQKYIGTNPFDWVGDETSLGLGTAMYDLMGKAAGVPVYKLFGQAYRKLVPVGSWTVSADPSHMADAVRKYSKLGYTWLKFHLSPFENIFDQLSAMEKVAPRGFKIQLDFTMHGTNDHMPGLCERIGNSAIIGAFEDPLFERDIQGYAELRKRSDIPIYYHHAPLGATEELQRRAADGYIVGHTPIGNAIRYAGAFAHANVPFCLQNVGGHITRSMTTHMQAAFKTAHFHFHCDAETWKSDVVNERPLPKRGLLRVSESPGLGVTLNRRELERLSDRKPRAQEKWIIVTTYEDGTKMYNLGDPADSLFFVRPDKRRLFTPSYEDPVTTEWWDNDKTKDFRNMMDRLQKEGVVLLKANSDS